MNHLPPPPFPQGVQNHMTADIMAVSAHGAVVETWAKENHILSAYGDHAREALEKRRCKIVGEHELDGKMMVHALALPPIFAVGTWTWGDLAKLIFLVWLFLIVVYVKIWSVAVAPNLKDRDSDEEE